MKVGGATSSWSRRVWVIVAGAAGFLAAWGLNVALLSSRGGRSVPQGSATVGSGNFVSGDAFFLVAALLLGMLLGLALGQGPRRAARNLRALPAMAVMAARSNPVKATGALLLGAGLPLLLLVAVSPLVSGTIGAGIVLAVLIGIALRAARAAVARRRRRAPELPGLAGLSLLGAVLGTVIGAEIASRPVKAVVACVLLVAGLAAAAVGRGRAAAAVAPALALLLLVLVGGAALAAPGAPLKADQFQLQLNGGAPTLGCEDQGENGGYYGCGEGGPATAPGIITVSSGPGGEALITLKATGPNTTMNAYVYDFVTFTVETDGPSQWVLTAPAGSDGYNHWAAFEMGGTATHLTGVITAINHNFPSGTPFLVSLTLPGGGFTLVSATPPPTPRATAAPSAQATPGATPVPAVIVPGVTGTNTSAPGAVVSLLPGVIAGAGAAAGVAFGIGAGSLTGIGDPIAYEPFVGLRVATFNTPNGPIKVNVPDDMSSESLTSGTTIILADPNNPNAHFQPVSLAEYNASLQAMGLAPLQVPPEWSQNSMTILLSAPASTPGADGSRDLTLTPASPQVTTPPNSGPVPYEPFVGLRQVTFETPNGPITVNVPDDMSAGDLTSGTTIILADPNNPNAHFVPMTLDQANESREAMGLPPIQAPPGTPDSSMTVVLTAPGQTPPPTSTPPPATSTPTSSTPAGTTTDSGETSETTPSSPVDSAEETWTQP